MLLSLLLIAAITSGGFALSYLIDDEKPLMWRIAVGNILGSAIFGTTGFLLALLLGLNAGVVLAALAIALLPLLLFYRREQRRSFATDWSRAKGKLQGANAGKIPRLAYYTFFFLLFFFFFDRAMLESGGGIFTGGSQNLGDLPFHLGAIFSFTEVNNFPPENPSFAGARFSYPLIADFITACFVKLGADVRDAMFVQNVSWAFALLIILERWVLNLTGDRLAARFAPPLLFFSGGLGFIWFLSDYWAQGKAFFEFLAQMPRDYTIRDGFRWGNSMVVLFITQRSLLLGMPLTLVVLTYLWKQFALKNAAARPENLSASPPLRVSASPRLPVSPSPLLVGLLAGLLPLIHLHSLAVLFVVGVFLFVLRPDKWRTWVTFAAGVAITAVPELLWSVSGSASETTKFFAWHFGWDKGETNFFWFWFINTGLFIPLLVAGLYLISRPDGLGDPQPYLKQSRKDAKAAKRAKLKTEAVETDQSPVIWFFLPFAFLFLVSNTAKLAPWEWDNIKVLIYWFVGSLPFVGLFIAWLWRKEAPGMRTAAVLCFIVLAASGFLDVWRTVSGQINYRVFDKDAVEIASQIRVRTAPRTLFLNAPTYNTAIVLTGRQSLMRYPGHLSSHGIDYAERESDVKRIYQGDPSALELMDKYGIAYVLVSPEERTIGPVNDQFFSRFPVAAESGQYRVYKIR